MSTLRLTTISNQSGSASVPSDTVINGSAKAWVNFNGTGTVAIRASFNVSSITDNGVGDYTVNFSTALVDANYACIPVAGNASGSTTNSQFGAKYTGIKTVSACQVMIQQSNAGADFDQNSVAFFR